MLRAFLILSALIIIVSSQSFDKGFRTVIHSSFPIDAPLRFDPNNDERLVLSIVKPSSDVSLKADDKHRLRIINIDHNLAQKNPRLNVKSTHNQSDSGVSVSARLTNQDESKSAPETKILVKQPVIDYGLPKINLGDISSFAASPETKFVSQKLGGPEPVSSRLFVSKAPTVEELLEKGYVLTDIFPLEFSADDAEFEFPTDRFLLPPNNVDSQLRPPEKYFREFKSVPTSGLSQNKNESQPALQPKISSINTDEVPDVTVRPLEVKYNFLPKTEQVGFHSGKKYISKFLMSPAVAYENPGTEGERFDIRRTPGTIKNKQRISTQRLGKEEENAETNSFASLTSESIDEAKTQGIPKTKYTPPSKNKDKEAFITSLFGDSTAESEEDIKSRLASSESGKLQNTKAKVYENPAANEKKALAGRVSAASGIESQTSGLLSSTNFENSNEKSNFDIKTPAYRQELKEYSVPSASNEESIFSSKLSEASEVKGTTFSSSSISNFQKQSSVRTEKASSSKFGAEGIASLKPGSTKYVAENNSAGLSEPEGFAIYFRKPSSHPQGKLGIRKSHAYSRMPIWYSAGSKSDPKQLHSNINLPYKAPIDSGSVKYVTSFNTEEENSSDFKSGAIIKSFEDFLKSEDHAIYYKTPSAHSGDNSESLPTRYGVPRSYEYSTSNAQDQQTHSFLGLTSIPTSSHELFQTNSDIYSALHIPSAVQNNAGYELPIPNSDTTPIFITDSEDKHLENSEKISIIYQPSSAGNINITPLSTSYGTPSPSLSSNIDVRRKTKLINKPFAEYGPPTTAKPSTTSRPPGDNEKLDIDIRTIPDSRIVLLKPPFEYGTPNVASSIRTPSGYLTQMKQRFEKKTYEFGVPVLKAPNTRPLSSYEVPIY